MTDVQLKILIPLEEYKTLQKIAKAHEESLRKFEVATTNQTEKNSLTLKDGHGNVNRSEERFDISQNQSDDPCKINENIDQSVETKPKEILINSESASVRKDFASERTLSLESIVSQIRPAFRSKAKNLMSILQQHPNDFGYDENGLVTIFKSTIPGMNKRAISVKEQFRLFY